MRTILIATDFSQAARNATEYGIAFAKAFHAKIILTGAYQQMPIPISDSPIIVTAEDLRRSVQEQLDTEALTFGMGTNVPIETVCSEGPAVSVIPDVAKKMKADLVILGMKDGRKGMRKFFGSTVTSLARKGKLPLLVIPEEVKYTDPLSIAFADDLRTDADIHILDTLRFITQRFHSNLRVVRVIGQQEERPVDGSNLPARLKKMLQTLDPVFDYPVNENITYGLKEFVASRRIDMLVMIPHRHSLLKRWFGETHTKSMIFEVTVPLLVLPDVRQKPMKVYLSDSRNSTTY